MYNAAISTTNAITTIAIFFKLCLAIRGYIFLQPRYLHEAVSYTSVGSYVITHPGTREAVDDRLVFVHWWRVHTIAAVRLWYFFPHFRRYTRRLRTCRSSLSLSQIGRAVRRGCALLLPNVKRINMTSGERVLWFVWNRRLDGEGSLNWNGEDWADSLVRHCDPTLETLTVTYRYFRRDGLSITP